MITIYSWSTRWLRFQANFLASPDQSGLQQFPDTGQRSSTPGQWLTRSQRFWYASSISTSVVGNTEQDHRIRRQPFPSSHRCLAVRLWATAIVVV
ncbi:hypothetical protein [Kibdelosporangium philippinense]|uniref:hypothetical protein n=1 Tax=Kibdelosporangium philippinense TaxID=211113 RepID=UPI00361DC071